MDRNLSQKLWDLDHALGMADPDSDDWPGLLQQLVAIVSAQQAEIGRLTARVESLVPADASSTVPFPPPPLDPRD